ncbi:MAG: cytochrome c, partial [Burkholderiales bacterium]
MRAPLLLALLVPALALPQDLYQTHCASCHGAGRLGAMGPALLPENLGRLKKAEAAKVIRQSRPGVQMPAFGGTLSEAEIA